MAPLANRIAIVGGGISGLTSAWAIRRKLPTAQVTIFESSARLGGTLQTESVGSFQIDNSADMFTTDPNHAIELCRDLGRVDELVSTLPVQQRAYVASENGFYPVPTGFSLMLPNNLESVLQSKLLDQDAKQRFLAEEKVVPLDSNQDESLRSFATRRFGQEVFERLIQPLVSGIYTADPDKLSMQATMSRFLKFEQEHGSLINAARQLANNRLEKAPVEKISFADQTASGARYDLFRAPPGGMGQLIEWLAAELPDIEINCSCPVKSIVEQENGGWQIKTRSRKAEDFDAVVVTVNSGIASKLFTDVDRSLAEELSSIEAASCAIVVLGMAKTQFRSPFEGYGIIIPSFLQQKMIAASFASNKFAGRAGDNDVLVRCFFGGALQPELVELPNEQLTKLAVEELGGLFNCRLNPSIAKVVRWRDAMPQYHLGHLDKVGRIESRLANYPSLALAGNSYRGVGIPICIESGRKAAEKIASFCQR